MINRADHLGSRIAIDLLFIIEQPVKLAHPGELWDHADAN
jgi:hypothetical protein